MDSRKTEENKGSHGLFPETAGDRPPSGHYYGDSIYYGAPHTDILHGGGISITWLLRAVLRKWLYVALGAVLGLSIAVYRSGLVTDVYQAQSMIEMSVRRPRIMNREDAVLSDRWGMNSTEVFNTRIHKFRGEDTRNAAIEVLRKQGVENPGMIAPASFSLVPESFLVRITCMHPDPYRAMVSANAYAEASVQVMTSENEDVSESAVSWLKKQAESQKQILDSIEKKLSEFRKENNLDLLRNKKALIDETIRSLNNELGKIRARFMQVHEQYEAVKNGDFSVDLYADDSIARQMADLRRAKTEYQRLLLKYRESHPEAQSARDMIELMEEGLAKAINGRRDALRKTLELLTRQTDRIEANIKVKQKQSAEIENRIVDENARIRAIERERGAADMSYQGVLMRMEEAKLSADEKTAAVKVSKLAQMPFSPVSSRRRRMILSGLMMGLFLGVGLALTKEWFEDYVTSVEDIENGLGLKVLGIIPYQKARQRQDLALATMRDIKKHQRFTESFVSLRTSLAVGSYGEVSRSILLTSAGIECGKTVSACNLACAFASTGTKTLLIDFDFRRPRLAKIFSIKEEKEKSLLHVLGKNQGEGVDFSMLPVDTGHENLSVIYNCCDHTIKPSSLLGKGVLERFMKWARDNFDQVILDSPPHGVLSDAAALSAHVDGVLIVCRHEMSRKRALRNTIRQLAHVDANILGAVINAAPIKKNLFSRYDYYYGSYSAEEYAAGNQ